MGCSAEPKLSLDDVALIKGDPALKVILFCDISLTADAAAEESPLLIPMEGYFRPRRRHLLRRFLPMMRI